MPFPTLNTVQVARRRLLAVLGLALALAAPGGCRRPSADAHFRRGEEFAKNLKFPEAIVEYRAGLQMQPARGDIHRTIAQLYLRTGDTRDSFKETIRAADLLPTDISAQVAAGNVLLLTRSFEDAKTRAKKVLALDPDNVQGQILLGNALAGLKNMDDAIREYQEALALNPNQDAAYINMGAVQMIRGETAQAESSFRKAIDTDPKSIPARMALANYFWAAGRANEAESTLQAAVALDSANVAANRALGMLYLGSNRAAEAEPYFRAMAGASGTPAGTLALADYYTIANRIGDARKVLLKLATNTETFDAAETRLAVLDAVEGQRASAHNRLRDVLDRNPHNNLARLLEARLLVIDGKRDQALTVANEIVKDDPKSPAAAYAYFLIGGIQASLDRVDDATAAFKEVLKRQSQPVAAELALASLHLSRGDANTAAAYTQEALNLEKGNAAARTMMARVWIAQGKVRQASEALASLRKEFPRSPEVLDLVASEQLASGHLDAARESYTGVASAFPGDFEALAGLVSLDVKANRAKDAVARIEGSLERLPPTPDLLMLAARVYNATGDPRKVEELLVRAIQSNPSRLTAFALLGNFYVERHQLGAAYEQFAKIVERDPESIPAQTMLGILLQAMRRDPEAERQYQKVLELDRKAPVAANNLAWLYAASNRNLDVAQHLAEIALQGLPHDARVNDTLGWIYYRKGVPDSAIRYLKASVEADATDPATFYHLGMAYDRWSERENARQALQHALDFNVPFDGIDEARKTLKAIRR